MRRLALSALLLIASSLTVQAQMTGQAQIEPPRGGQLRKELLDAVRPHAEAFVGPPVEFMVETLHVDGTTALAELEIQRPGGVKIPPWSPIDYPYIAAILQNQGGRWVVVAKAVSPNEPYFCEYRATLLRRLMPQPCF